MRRPSRLTTRHIIIGVEMSTLPCRYFYSKGALHREDGRLAFYREMFGEPKLHLECIGEPETMPCEIISKRSNLPSDAPMLRQAEAI